MERNPKEMADAYYALGKGGKNHIGLIHWITYYYQINSIIELGDIDSILEIGVGNKIFSNHIRSIGYNLTTFDHDDGLHPDIVGDITELDLGKKFDCITCFEVLEHLPLEDAKKAIQKINEHTSKYAIISVPYSCFYTTISFNFFYFSGFQKIYKFLGLTPFEPISFQFKIPFFFLKRNSCEFHYWEVGQKNMPKKRFHKILEESGFHIRKTFHNPFYPYHYYLVLDKKNMNE